MSSNLYKSSKTLVTRLIKGSTELTVLDTKLVADEEGMSRMRQIEKTRTKQSDAFIKELLIEGKTPLRELITRNKPCYSPAAAGIDKERLVPFLTLVYRLLDQKC